MRMMKKALILMFLAAMSMFASAAPDKIKCPVMTSSDVVIKDATKKKMYADYKGRRYFFCCAGCPEAFKKNPEKYKNRASIPTPKKKK
jgi:YHS domain-containing protein